LLIFSVAYPQDNIPDWNTDPFLASQLFPGIDYSNFLIGDNFAYAEAAYLWAINSLQGFLTQNGITTSLRKKVAFGHSQGAYIVHRLNTVYALDSVVMSAPGPIDLLARCADSVA
jgi:hypothetical protein